MQTEDKRKRSEKGTNHDSTVDCLLCLSVCLSVGVALMSMQSPPVNSLSLEFLTELCVAVEKLEMDKSCRGVILTSVKPSDAVWNVTVVFSKSSFPMHACMSGYWIQGLPKVFSAGLDILEMYGKGPENCGEFWRAVQEIWLKLYSSNMVVIAAINVWLN